MFGKNIDSPPPPAVREIVNWAADFWIITSISILSIFAFSRIFGSELVFDSSLIIGEDTGWPYSARRHFGIFSWKIIGGHPHPQAFIAR